MSSSVNLPELGGYDYEFTSKVPDDWECLVCHLTMKDPVQIVGCGHRICNICMESLLRRPSPTCPADRLPLSREKIFPDAACHRKILDLTVKCLYFGCPWTGELREVEKHHTSCLFKVVQCPNSGCEEQLTKQDLKIHVTFECSWRKTNCDFCKLSYIYNQKQSHLAACTKFPFKCTKCGLRDITREKLKAHIHDECPKTEVECEYKNVGCKAVFPRSATKFHSESEVEAHLALALRGLETTQIQVRALLSLVKDQSQQIKRLEKMTKSYAPYIWKIPDFQVVYDRAVTGEQETVLSEPFYLSKNGYKIRIKLMPNGGNSFRTDINSNVKGQFLSVYIKVIPGEYDSVLQWPFKEKLCVTLIDQDVCFGKRVNISQLIDFEEGVDEWLQPSEETDVGFGFAKFVRQSVLQTRSYLKNNTIFIMVSKA